MNIVQVETLLAKRPFAASEEWATVQREITDAIAKVVWPVGSDKFTIYPQSGKKRGEGNGVGEARVAPASAGDDQRATRRGAAPVKPCKRSFVYHGKARFLRHFRSVQSTDGLARCWA
jgi:hypothetical protein